MYYNVYEKIGETEDTKYTISNLKTGELYNIKVRGVLVKDSEEIRNIKRACEITDACFEHLKSFIKIGKTEKEIAFEIEMFFKTHGADGLAFDTIVAVRRKFRKSTLDSN